MKSTTAQSGVLVAVLLLTACASMRSGTDPEDGSRGDDGGFGGNPSSSDARAGRSGSVPGSDASGGVDVIDGVRLDSIACRSGIDECSAIGNRAAPLPSPVCPSERPQDGASCSKDALSCSYGTSLTARCRTLFECISGEWNPSGGLAPDEQCPQQPAGFCPTSAPKDGSKCIVGDVHASVSCDYPPDVSCYCAAGSSFPGAEGEWECYGAPRNGDCPEVLPNLGDGCSKPGLQCRYGYTRGCYAFPYGTVFCYQNYWEPGTEPGCAE